MYQRLFFMMMCVLPVQSIWASDFDKVKEVIQTYSQGYQNADVALIQKAFHPDTNLLSVDAGHLDKTTMNDWIKNLEDRHQRHDFRKAELKILSIDVKDYTSVVKLRLKFEKFIFTDYLSLLKINNEWKIVGKIYHFQER